MYSADFTGKEEQLTPSQRCLAVRRMPSLLEYLSYNCNFMGILAGPTCSYNDYMAFIEGTAYQPRHLEANGKENGKYKHTEPSPKFCPVERSIDDKFIASTPFILQVLYLYLSMLATRPKYYFIWTLSDAINNAAGFGFNGYNKDGTPRWDLISNLRILDIEFATSFKMFLDNWNIQTALWLKRVCYERCPINPTAATFLLSAMWHGLRHNIRPYFLGSTTHKSIYDVITWAGTQIVICYTVVPFVLLAVGPSLKFYRSWHYCIHIACLLLVLALPVKPRHLRIKEEQQQQNTLQVDHNSHSITDNNCNQKHKAT
ncbi:unnamed protein product [Coregonus sp. 'balchen']|nr:unnamed protein product [Coregonus sp. 'balchen']